MLTVDLRNRKLWLAITVIILLFTSFAVNIYYYYDSSSFPRLTWTTDAAVEAEKVADIDCSNHGRAYTDGVIDNGFPVCECHNCYSGPTCSIYNQTCVADAKVGDAIFLKEYWLRHRKNIAVLISGWHRMSYFIGKNFTSMELDKQIRLLHEKVGNAKVDDKHLVFGNGITQLLNGIIISLSPNLTATPNATVKKVVAYVPHYPVFKSQTTYFNHRGYEWKGNASDYVNTNTPKDFIELVTSPNNPDGLLRKAIINGSFAVYDHATYWPHFAPIKYASDEDIMLFTLSKYTGHAGSRFGWAFIRDKDVYEKLNNYTATNTEGVSRETQLRTLKIIKDILQQMEKNHGTMRDFNKFGYEALRARWNNLTDLVSLSDRFSLQEMSPEDCNYFKNRRDPSPAYGWLECKWPEETNCAVVLKSGKILAHSGAIFETSSRYARLSIIKTQDDFNQLMDRLSVLVRANRTTAQYNYDINKEKQNEHPFIYGGDQ